MIDKFQQANDWLATWQLINSVGPYVLLWVGMYFALSVSWWLVIPLALLAGAFLVRIFIIFHDCGHGSFFRSQKANDFWGVITGLISFTPYQHWKWEHSVHHATNGDLDRRGVGDIWTLTVEEYLSASRWKRFSYRLARNPFILFFVAPLYLFLIHHRFPLPKAKAKIKTSVWLTNIVLIGIVGGLIAAFGFFPWLIIQLIVTGVAGGGGVWLFYVQHQFEGAYWERGEDWDFTDAALKGSSYYKLPKVLQWFSGNIGFHHIHHLSSRIPNYNLEKCHHSDPMFAEVKPTTLWESFKSITYRLWDEKSKQLISFGQLRKIRRGIQMSAQQT